MKGCQKAQPPLGAASLRRIERETTVPADPEFLILFFKVPNDELVTGSSFARVRLESIALRFGLPLLTQPEFPLVS